MTQIENVISWLQSNRALSDNPTSWIPPKRHYAKFEEIVSSLSEGELRRERAKYNHTIRTDLLITGLGLAAAKGAAIVLEPYVGLVALALSAGPAALTICLVGITRGIIREGEKEILEERLGENQTPRLATFSAQQAK